MASSFPECLAPNWISNPIPPLKPNVQQQFQGGAIARIRFSAIASNGQFTAQWNSLNACDTDAFYQFWQEVDTFEAFTLPKDFFHCCYTQEFEDRLRSYSPSGLWLFRDSFPFDPISVKRSQIQATLLGVIY